MSAQIPTHWQIEMKLRASLVAIAIALASPAVSAQAQPEGGSDAVDLGREGLELYNQQRWIEAYDRFAAADGASHSPVFALYMARCKRGAGDLVAARNLLRQIELESIADGAPDTWKRAQSEATSERPPLEARIPSVRVRVRGTQDAIVSVDGAAIADLTQELELNPGTHLVEARSSGASTSATITLRESQRGVAVELAFPNATPGGPRPVETDTQAASAEGPAGTPVPGAVLVAFGGAGLIVGIATGVVAANKTSAIKERCIDDSCLRSDEDEANRAKRLATASTVSFAVGGAVAVVGIALLIWQPGGGSDAASAWQLGPGWLGYRRAF